MFCPECGKEIKEGSVFCIECGARIIKVKSAIRQAISGFDKLTLLFLIGSGLLIISVFMPWVELGFTSVSGFQMFRPTLLFFIPYSILIGGGITVYYVLTGNTRMTKAAIITGVIALVVFAWLFFTSVYRGNVEMVGVGPYLMLTGGIVYLAAALILKRQMR